MQSGGADDGDQRDVGLFELAQGNQSFRTAVDGHACGQQGTQFGLLAGVVDRHMPCAGLTRLLGELGGIVMSCQSDDFDAIRQVAGDFQCRAADGAGGPQQHNTAFSGLTHADGSRNTFR